MADVIPAIDYTDRDQEAIKAAMIRSIPLYTPEWTDHNNTDPGIALLSMFAGHLDILHFYVDRAAGEMFLPTAVKRESVVKLLQLINYTMRSIVPATADVTFTLPQTLPNDVLIPSGTKVQTVASEQESPVVFETLANLTILSGDLSGSVSVREGETDEEDLGQSTGQAFQQISVSATIIVEDSFTFYVDEGTGYVAWTEVDSFTNSLPTDTHYILERDADEAITVILGDNLQGRIPPATSLYKAEFVVISGDRGGVYGNVGAGKISIVNSTILAEGTRVALAVTNPLQASGGEDRQSIEEAKRLGPASLLALGRAVTSDDFKNLAEQYGGIAKAAVVQGVEGESCCACNVELYIAPTGGGVASSALKADLLDYFDDRKMIGTCITIEDPTYVLVDIIGVVSAYQNVDIDSVEDGVSEALDAFFDIDGSVADFGQDVHLGNLFSTIEGVDGVDHVSLSKVSRRPDPVYEVWNGDPTFGLISVGEGVAEEIWTITWLSATTFSVQGTVSGLQTDGTIDVQYTSDLEEVSFLISSGSVAPDVGDHATFKTSPYFGTISIDSTEIMSAGTIQLTYAVIAARSSGSVCT